nr:MAG TPA: hypothetical protein [Caudoviricetes sp.]
MRSSSIFYFISLRYKFFNSLFFKTISIFIHKSLLSVFICRFHIRPCWNKESAFCATLTIIPYIRK